MIKRYDKYIKVKCKDCGLVYDKRYDSIKMWSGRCCSCAQKYRMNLTENKERSRLLLYNLKKRKDYKELNSLGKKNSNYRGKLHHSWKGGITQLVRSIRTMSDYYDWRTEVFKRDCWTCQNCREKGYVHAHHIKLFIDIIIDNNIKDLKQARVCEELWDIDNGVTLCQSCHNKIHNKKDGGLKLRN